MDAIHSKKGLAALLLDWLPKHFLEPDIFRGLLAGVVFSLEDNVESLKSINLLGPLGAVPPKGIPQKFIGILFDRNCNLIELTSLVTKHLFVFRASLRRSPGEMAIYAGLEGVRGERSIFGHAEKSI